MFNFDQKGSFFLTYSTFCGAQEIQLLLLMLNLARRGKKAFLSNQCKEIEKNNKMGKTRDLFKKIRDTKGTFHAKMNTIKDRNCKDLREVEYIKKKWQEYKELYRKGLNDPDNHDGVITHLEPDMKLPTFAGSSEKQESTRKTSISALLTMPKPLTMLVTINCGKF